jgi:hypothetical protein
MVHYIIFDDCADYRFYTFATCSTYPEPEYFDVHGILTILTWLMIFLVPTIKPLFQSIYLLQTVKFSPTAWEPADTIKSKLADTM